MQHWRQLQTDGYAAAVDTALAGYESIENTSYGIGFAVNEDLSLSYTIEQSKPDAMTAATTTYEMEIHINPSILHDGWNECFSFKR